MYFSKTRAKATMFKLLHENTREVKRIRGLHPVNPNSRSIKKGMYTPNKNLFLSWSCYYLFRTPLYFCNLECLSYFLVLTHNNLIKNVCNGKFRGSSIHQSNRTKLHCLLIDNDNPYLTIGPFKFEIKNIEPFRTVIHDFLTPFEMDRIEMKIRPQLTYEKSQSLLIYSGSSEASIPDNYKAATIYFEELASDEIKQTGQHPKKSAENETFLTNMEKLAPDKQRVMAGITQRIQLATYLIIGKDDRKGEFRASIYGLGGMTEQHGDAYGVEDNTKMDKLYSDYLTAGDVIATMILWLTNVPLGGGTYFCSKQFEDVVTPEKGSALLWINLKASGFQDHRQNHGGCPVAEGNKFSVTKWFLHYYQWKRFPCDMSKDMMINVGEILHPITTKNTTP